MTENERIKNHIEDCEHRIGNILGFMESNSDADIFSCEENIVVLKDVIIALEEIQQYRAIGTIGEFKDLKEKNEKQLEAIKLLTIAAICYEKNLDIIRKEMKENKELLTLYCKLPTVQYIKNTIALSKLEDSDIDVNNIESIDEIIRIFDWQ